MFLIACVIYCFRSYSIIVLRSQQLVLEDVRQSGRAEVRYLTLRRLGEFRTMAYQDGGLVDDVWIMRGAQGWEIGWHHRGGVGGDAGKDSWYDKTVRYWWRAESYSRAQDVEVDLGKIVDSLPSKDSHEKNLCSASALQFEDARREWSVGSSHKFQQYLGWFGSPGHQGGW